MVSGESPQRLHGQAPFEAYVELLRHFLSRRAELVERIQALLNAQRKPAHELHDVPRLSRLFEDCFFTLAGLSSAQAALRRRLDEAHWASGFKPRHTPGQPNDIIDPAEMMSRAFHLWRLTRWPGQQGRVRYAQTLFNLYFLRLLMLLSMRIWDGEAPGERLSQVQAVLDELWRTTPADQPVFLRDARWLFPLAQSPTTDELRGYFDVAEQIATTLAEPDRLAIQKASVQMAGGHLRSQLRHVATQNGVALDERNLTLLTRRSNALDLATIVQALVPLLERYERAVRSGETDARLELAAAICQGISPDPELFVSRVELLGPYTMIEPLFAEADEAGHSAYTAVGRRHISLLREYEERIGRLAKSLHDDCRHFRPVEGAYSPYGALYGFSSNLLEHIALKSATGDMTTRFTLEDAFTDGGEDKLAWVSGWRKLPHIPRDVAKLFAYPQQFAVAVYERVEQALQRRAAGTDRNVGLPTGRLYVVAGDNSVREPFASQLPDLAVEYFVSSDRQLVAERKAQPYEETKLLHSRAEGEFAVSYETSGGWAAITKDFFTAVLGEGRSVRVVLPRDAAEVLRLMCPKLLAEQR